MNHTLQGNMKSLIKWLEYLKEVKKEFCTFISSCCCGTDLKLLGNFDYRGEIITAGIVYKEYRDGPADFYNPPEWQGIDWRTTDYRVENPNVLLEGAINDLMKQLMTYLYENDTREEV